MEFRTAVVTCGVACLPLLAACAGSGAVQIFHSGVEVFPANYVTFEHPFTEVGEADATRRARAQCAQKKQVAVMTSRACTLSRCTTSYQCMTPDEAATHAPAPPASK